MSINSRQIQFTADVLTSAGVVTGAGPLYNIMSVSVTEEIDRIGQVEVVVPAVGDREIALVAAQNQIQVHAWDGFTYSQLATGYMHNIALTYGDDGMPVYSITGPDLLYELVELSTGYNCLYDDRDVKTVIVGTTATATSLLGGTGWTQGSVEDFGNATIEYSAETRFSALTMLCEQLGRHVRQGSTEQTLDFGVFGASSGVRLTNMHHMLGGQQSTTDISIIGSATITTMSADIENRLFPLGKDGFDMRDATAASANIKAMTVRGPTGHSSTCNGAITAADTSFIIAAVATIVIGDELWLGDATDWTQTHEIVKVTNVAGTTITILDEFANSFADGTTVIRIPQFYVESAASQATYGVRENCPQFGWIGPADKSANIAEQQLAADALYAAANARMTRYADSYESYQFAGVKQFPSDVKVGQKIRVVFNGAMNAFGGTIYKAIDDDFYVTRIKRSWAADGSRSVELDVSDVNRPTPNNASLVLFNLDTMKWIGLG